MKDYRLRGRRAKKEKQIFWGDEYLDSEGNRTIETIDL